MIVAKGFSLVASKLAIFGFVAMLYRDEDSGWYCTRGSLGEDGLTWEWSEPEFVAKGQKAQGSLDQDRSGRWHFTFVTPEGDVMHILTRMGNGMGPWTEN